MLVAPSPRSSSPPGPPSRPEQRKIVFALVPLVVAALLAWLAVSSLALPARGAGGGAPGDFAATRAVEHLAVIASAPRPVGSAQHARARDYLVARARSLGAEVEVQAAEVIHEQLGNPFAVAAVHDVVARLRGRGGGKAVLVTAHYDSVPGSPGAGDDGVGVAAMLEVLRILAAEPRGRNDIVFLFTDAEEIGLLGAAAFAERAWSDDYRVVLNFDARGSTGPSLMFEAGADNGGLLRALAASGAPVFASSFLGEGFRWFDLGDTDLTVFLRKGIPGLNFAFLDGVRNYHTGTDDLGRLDPRSLQHQGDLMLGMLRQLRDADLLQVRAPDAIYFDLFGRILLHYPEGAALPLAASGALAVVALLVLAIRRGHARMGRIARAAAAGLVGVATAVLFTAIELRVLALVRPADLLPLGEPYQAHWFIVAFLLTAAAAVAAVGAWARGRFSDLELVGGVALVLSLLALGSAAFLPGASYLAVWPLLAGLPALFARCQRPATGGPAALGMAMLAPGVAAVLFAPLVAILFQALGAGMGIVPVAVAAMAAVTALPSIAGTRFAGRAAAVGLIGAITALVVGLATSGFDRDQPRLNALLYAQENGEARLLAIGDEADAWTAHALGSSRTQVAGERYFPTMEEAISVAPTPGLALPPPEASILEERTRPGGGRDVSVRFRSARRAWMLQLTIDPTTRVDAVTVAGKRLDAAQLQRQGRYPAKAIVFRCWVGPDGIAIRFELPAPGPLRLHVADTEPGLPALTLDSTGPRPPDTAAFPYGWPPGDASIVIRHFDL